MKSHRRYLFTIYRDTLFPFLTECFVIKETFIATFAASFYKVYDDDDDDDDDGNILKTISLIDLSVNIERC